MRPFRYEGRPARHDRPGRSKWGLELVYPMYILDPMKTRLQRWGNSLGLRIPKAFAEEARLEAGSQVDLTIDQRRRLIVEAIGPEYELADLLAGVTDENLHAEVPTGARRGREVW
jgi:antitoxin MazE